MNEDIELLKDRVSTLERDVGELKSRSDPLPAQPWWQRIAGRFENDAAFEEIVRLGASIPRSPSSGGALMPFLLNWHDGLADLRASH